MGVIEIGSILLELDWNLRFPIVDCAVLMGHIHQKLTIINLFQIHFNHPLR